MNISYHLTYILTVIVCILGVSILPSLSLAQSTTTAAELSTSTLSTSTTETDIVPAPVIDTRQPALQPIAQTRIKNLAANISNRLDASVRRMTNVADRLDSRITKMSEAGFEVTPARTALTDARARLGAAMSILSTIDLEVTAFIGSSDPRAAWIRLGNIYGTINGHVVAAHTALRECIQALETAPLTVPTTATTTPETSTSPLPE
jgi:hypothetical protein